MKIHRFTFPCSTTFRLAGFDHEFAINALDHVPERTAGEVAQLFEHVQNPKDELCSLPPKTSSCRLFLIEATNRPTATLLSDCVWPKMEDAVKAFQMGVVVRNDPKLFPILNSMEKSGRVEVIELPPTKSTN